MYARGHVGLGFLAVFSTYIILDIKGKDYLVMALLIAGLSTLPDIDLSLEIKHRAYTHNILFAIVAGFLTALLFRSTFLGFWKGFAVGFLAVILHILGDILTYAKFKPLWPINGWEVALGLFKSSDRRVNEVLSILGAITMLYYILHIYAGVI